MTDIDAASAFSLDLGSAVSTMDYEQPGIRSTPPAGSLTLVGHADVLRGCAWRGGPSG